MDGEKQIRVQQKLLRELGPVITAALQDPAVIEIMLNPDGKLWIEKMGAGCVHGGDMTPSAAEALMGTIATCLQTVVNRENPILEGELPFNGSRFAGVVPPIVAAPSFTIRKRASRVFTLAEYVTQGVMTEAQCSLLRDAIRDRQNIVLVGGTGSGKTTLVNALIDEIARNYPDHRLILIEDTAELQCSAENKLTLHTADAVDMLRLLRFTMRSRPDRIVVGEVRGAEALAMLKAWNTGHPGGICTVHANGALAGLIRLESLVAEATPTTPQQKLIAEAVNVVAVISKTPEGRRLTEILHVEGYDAAAGNYRVTSLST